MAEETVGAASSAADVDVFRGENVSLAEFSKYRADGELPARFKPTEQAESDPADAPEQTVEEPEGDEPESEPESDPEEAQEQPQKGSGAEKRIKQLLAETKELKRKLEAAKPDATPDPSTAASTQPQPPQTFKDWQKTFKPSQWIEEYAKSNPSASYEDANFAMSIHVGEAMQHFRSVEQARELQAKESSSKISEAQKRYEDFDEKATPFVEEFVADRKVSPVLKEMLNDSDVFADLAYTLAGDDKFMALARTDPGKAIRHIARVEGLILEELAKTGEPASGTPERKQTQAPKPPSPVGGGSTRGFDVSDESLSADEWMRKRNQELNRRKG